jgi:hypothetical protein
MNRMNKFGGDERSNYRLLSYLNQNLSLDVQQIKHIRKNVYLAQLKNGCQLIMKGFSARRSLLLQSAFTSSLKIHHFPYTYSFYLGLPSVYFDSKFYGFLEYIEPSYQTFFYNSKENCQQGLALLQKYHHTSKQLVGSYKRLLPVFDLQNKWKERFLLFIKNKDILSPFISWDIYSELVSWAEWSLAGIEMENNMSPNVILHGDLAHHNFIRSKDGTLFLIDFDLISIGPEIVDYLQYANRILPFLDWSLHDLTMYKPFQSYFQQKMFLYALAFPTDIFREWNRLIKDGQYSDPKKIHSSLYLTISQFESRRKFVHDLFQLV